MQCGAVVGAGRERTMGPATAEGRSPAPTQVGERRRSRHSILPTQPPTAPTAPTPPPSEPHLRGAAAGAALQHRAPHVLDVVGALAADAAGRVKVAVGGDDGVGGQPRLPLQRVDVLREAAHQQALVVQQADEVVRGGGLVVAREQLLLNAVGRVGRGGEIVLLVEGREQ